MKSDSQTEVGQSNSRTVVQRGEERGPDDIRSGAVEGFNCSTVRLSGRENEVGRSGPVELFDCSTVRLSGRRKPFEPRGELTMGKKYENARKLVNSENRYSLDEA